MLRISSRMLPDDVRGPEARMAYDSAGNEGTRKERRQEPTRSAEIPEATGVWFKVMVMPFSSEANPKPETLIVAPGSPWVPLRTMAGVTRKGTSSSLPELETVTE